MNKKDSIHGDCVHT